MLELNENVNGMQIIY